MTARLSALTIAAVLVLAVAATASAGQPSGASGTETVTCRYDAHRARTECVHSTVTVRAGGCVDYASRLYARDETDSTRAYRGNVIRSTFDGVTVAGSYAAVVQPRVRPLSDSGPHAFTESFTVDDSTCT